MQPLDPLTIPLYGCRLIEASAGTGKTYTLALLFLRLLLERRLEVDHILVVTFTRPATGELRDRIRARLRDSLDLLDGRGPDDPLLAALLKLVPADQARRLLADALVRIDEAAIFTIHGFCQRALQDNAFEVGGLFETTVIEQEDDLRQEVIEDFWRNRFYGVTVEEAAWATHTWGEPAGVLQRLGRATSAALVVDIIPAINDDEIGTLRCQSHEHLAELRAQWPQARTEVISILEDDPCLKRNADAYHRTDRVPKLIAAMDWLATGPEEPFLLPEGIDRLSAGIMAHHLFAKSSCTQPPNHPFFRLFEQFHASHSRLLQLLAIRVLREARDYLLTELDRRKTRRGVIAFDDMLTRLGRALDDPHGGDRLADALFRRYPAALVDEFQDTDPVQYRLFSRIHNREAGALFLIGDPKQAIYAFRGADIFTYICARRDTPEANRSTMPTNYRSTPAMVNLVNTLFSRRPDAFIFYHDIPFYPVQAVPDRTQPLLVDGQPVLPLTALVLDSSRLAVSPGKPINKEQATLAAAAFCADEIFTLLDLAAAGRASLDDRPLTAGDIAILAPTHTTAEAMRQALRARGLHSVSLLQQSIFTTEEARQLTWVLTAILNLTDPAGVRACLATDLFGLDAARLHAFKEGDLGWNAQMEQLATYQRVWREQGFLSMFQQLLAEQGVTRRLTAQPGGTRALTNYLHLAELLQESPTTQHGMAGLLRWLRQQRHAPGNTGDSQLIRLEDDERVIRIVTIHRAKGLEFPVVVLPFLWAVRESKKDNIPLFHDRNNFRLMLDLGTGRQEHQDLQSEEELAEHLRLLYVAVTRAKSCCLLCWGRVKGLERTGLAHLLHKGQQPEHDEALLTDLEQLNTTTQVLACKLMPKAFGQARMTLPAPTTVLAAQTFSGRIPTSWGMTSYSRLIAGAASDQDHDQLAAARPLPVPADFDDIFAFPRGPAAGTCLHTLLERLNLTQPAAAQETLINTTLAQAGIDLRWLPATIRWVDDLLAVEIADGCHLRALTPQDRISELAFFFPLEHINLHALNNLLAASGHEPLPAGTARLQGLMKGFIDLVFRHRGRYYLADYKSNHLGSALDHYSPDRLDACMREHRYPLQYLIYTLALHRYLRQRMADYSYERHFGGVRYLFLRAMRPTAPSGTGIVVARPEFQLIDGLDRCCRGLEVR